MEEFVKLVGEDYADDSVSPGVTVSYLAKKEKWYMSVNRYKGSIKQTLCAASEKDFAECFAKLRETYSKLGKKDYS